MVMVVVVVFACVMYVIEGAGSGFESIPMSIYWAVVTITTVGYGDLVPQTPAGRFVAGFGMLVGYSIIALPTAITLAQACHSTRPVTLTKSIVSPNYIK